MADELEHAFTEPHDVGGVVRELAHTLWPEKEYSGWDIMAGRNLKDQELRDEFTSVAGKALLPVIEKAAERRSMQRFYSPWDVLQAGGTLDPSQITPGRQLPFQGPGAPETVEGPQPSMSVPLQGPPAPVQSSLLDIGPPSPPEAAEYRLQGRDPFRSMRGPINIAGQPLGEATVPLEGAGVPQRVEGTPPYAGAPYQEPPQVSRQPGIQPWQLLDIERMREAAKHPPRGKSAEEIKIEQAERAAQERGYPLAPRERMTLAGVEPQYQAEPRPGSMAAQRGQMELAKITADLQKQQLMTPFEVAQAVEQMRHTAAQTAALGDDVQRAGILRKVQRGESLKPGEQELYDMYKANLEGVRARFQATEDRMMQTLQFIFMAYPGVSGETQRSIAADLLGKLGYVRQEHHALYEKLFGSEYKKAAPQAPAGEPGVKEGTMRRNKSTDKWEKFEGGKWVSSAPPPGR